MTSDTPNPLGVYGASKLNGEIAVASLTEGHALIIRTAWVYSAHGTNFVETILRLLNERDEVRVVSDQIGTPTWAKGLAELIGKLANRGPVASGVYNWTDAGVANWYDFAVAIQHLGLQIGILKDSRRIIPIDSSEYSTTARRPSYSVLCKMQTWKLIDNRSPRHLQSVLAGMFADNYYPSCKSASQCWLGLISGVPTGGVRAAAFRVLAMSVRWVPARHMGFSTKRQD